MFEDSLTDTQIERQDFVDNAIHKLLNDLSPDGMVVEWDITHIHVVSDAIQEILVNRLHVMTEMDFYPYLKEVPYDDN